MPQRYVSHPESSKRTYPFPQSLNSHVSYVPHDPTDHTPVFWAGYFMGLKVAVEWGKSDLIFSA